MSVREKRMSDCGHIDDEVIGIRSFKVESIRGTLKQCSE